MSNPIEKNLEEASSYFELLNRATLKKVFGKKFAYSMLIQNSNNFHLLFILFANRTFEFVRCIANV